jgi:hypothetical protein
MKDFNLKIIVGGVCLAVLIEEAVFSPVSGSTRRIREDALEDIVFYSSTMSGRLSLNDDFIIFESRRYIDPAQKELRIVDLGCGFPPITSKELAERLNQHYPAARLYAIDNKFPESAVISADEPDKVALFDEENNLIGIGYHLLDFDYQGILEVRYPTREEKEIYTQLKIRLESSPDYKGEGKLIPNLKQYFLNSFPQIKNLQFMKDDFDFSLEEVDIIRVANMIEFYSREEQAQAKEILKGKLRERGILILETDTNIPRSSESPISDYLTIIYQRIQNRLLPREVEFSLPLTLSGEPAMMIGQALLRFEGDEELNSEQYRIRLNLPSPEGDPSRERSYVEEVVKQLNQLGYKALLREHKLSNASTESGEAIYTVAVLYYPDGRLKR